MNIPSPPKTALKDILSMEYTTKLTSAEEPRLGDLSDKLWKAMRVSDESYNLIGDLYSFTRPNFWIAPPRKSGDPLYDLLWSFIRSRKRRILMEEINELYAIVSRDWITSERFAYLLRNPESNHYLAHPSEDRLEKRIIQALVISPRHLSPQWVRSLYEETLANNDGDSLRANLELAIIAEAESLIEI